MDLKAQIVVAGMFREGDPEVDDGFVQNSIEGLFRSFVLPELTERGEASLAIPERALIVLPLNAPPLVHLGPEAAFTAVAGAGADLVDPRDVYVGQITDVWPDAVDPDAGWSGWVTADGGRVLVCDFRRNRQAVVPMIERSREFLESSMLSLEAGLVAPALEHLNTAAELAVIVLIRLGADKVGRDHRKRREWLDREIRFSDIPPQFGVAVGHLARARNAARYAEDTITVTVDDTRALYSEVAELVGYAERRAG